MIYATYISQLHGNETTTSVHGGRIQLANSKMFTPIKVRVGHVTSRLSLYAHAHVLVLFSHLSESLLDHLLLPIPFNPFEPGVEQQVLLGCQVSMLDVKLRTHPQVVVDFLYVRAYVVTGNAANTTGWLI